MTYDLGIIGAGWAGFNAATRARELGLSVCLMDKGPLGGTCLNQGCIPTKALIYSAKVYALAKKSREFGVDYRDVQIDLSRIQSRKDDIIKQLCLGMQSMLKGIDLVNSAARFVSTREIELDKGSIKAHSILIAAGSRPYTLAQFPFDHKKIISSDDALQIKKIPASILVIGGGVIGCEFAGLFRALGSRVAIAEIMPRLLPGSDSEAGRKLAQVFKKKGIECLLAADASALDISAYELVLVAVGRKANIEGLGLENAGVKTSAGLISVDDTLKTSTANIYACGDCASKLMLAHYASYQGRLATENIANKAAPKKIDASAIPSCIFTDPEIAAVGVGEEEAEASGIEVKVDRIQFLANGAARILDETEGFIKIVSDAAGGRILGGLVIAPRATELIAPLTLAVSARLNRSALRDTVFAHPTLSESLSEAVKFT